MNKGKSRPFWQVLVLTLVTSVASGFIAYTGASSDGKDVSAQTLATANVLLDSHEKRIQHLEQEIDNMIDLVTGTPPEPEPVASLGDFLLPEFADYDSDPFLADAGVTSQPKKKTRSLPDAGTLLPLNDPRVQKVREMY